MARKMYTKPGEYEQKAREAKQITAEINNGGINLSELLTKYKKDVNIIKNLHYTLHHMANTVAKVETSDDNEVPFARDKGGKDITNNVKIPNSDKMSSTNKQSKSTVTPTTKQSPSKSNHQADSNKSKNDSKTPRHFNPSSLF